MKEVIIKVSVIIPVYNMAQYLGECLDSIGKQTLEGIEMIAIDDGSTDESLTVLKEYQKKYDNLVVLHQENRGTGNARNQGIRRARGKYIALMDPDDYYPHNDSLENLYEAAEKQNVLICGGIIVRNFDGVREPLNEEQDREYFCDRMVLVKEYPYLNGQTRFLYRTEMLHNNHIYYPEYRGFEDPPFTLRAFLYAGKFYGINKEVYEYRVGHKDVHYPFETSRDILYGFRDIFKMAKENNLENLCKKSLGIAYSTYVVPKYKYSFSGNKEIDKTIEEINAIIETWPVADKAWILTREDVIRYREESLAEWKRIVEILERNSVIIYGAGASAARFLRMFSGHTENIIGAAVTDKTKSRLSVENIEVKQIEEYMPYQEKAFIIVAVDKKYQKEIEDHLQSLGFLNIHKIDSKKIQLAEELVISYE